MSFRIAWPTLGLLAVLVVAGLGASGLAAVSLGSFVDFAPPIRGLPAQQHSAAALSERVVLVVVDGLRYDASLRMPYLNELRGRGAEFIAEVAPPSLSLPGWTALATGAGPEASGVTTNWHEGPALVDSLLGSAKRAGRVTGVVGSAGWEQLFPGEIDLGRYAYPPGEAPSPAGSIPTQYGEDIGANLAADSDVVRAAVSVLKGEAGQRPDLLVVHLLAVDKLGHAYGGRSEEYDRGAENVDRLLRDLTAALDLTRETLVVTSDHGHLDRGGHGGIESEVVRTPLVLVGKGISRPRNAGRAPTVVRQVDVAPTLAVLLGVGIPAESEGRPRLEALALDANARAERGVQTLIARRDRALRYADALGAAPPPPELDLPARNALAGRFYARAASDAEDALDQLDFWSSQAREERMGSDRVARLPIGVLGAAIALVPLIALRPRRETLLAFPFGVVYAAAYWVIFLWRGYGFSFSALDQAGSVERFVAECILAATLLALALAAIVGLAYLPKGPPATLGLIARYLFWAGTVVAWQILVVFVLYGATYRLYLPDPTLALVYFVALLQLAGFAIAGLITGILAVASVTRATAKPEPGVR